MEGINSEFTLYGSKNKCVRTNTNTDAWWRKHRESMLPTGATCRILWGLVDCSAWVRTERRGLACTALLDTILAGGIEENNTLFDISNEYPLCIIRLVIGEVKKDGLWGGVGRAAAMQVPRVWLQCSKLTRWSVKQKKGDQWSLWRPCLYWRIISQKPSTKPGYIASTATVSPVSCRMTTSKTEFLKLYQPYLQKRSRNGKFFSTGKIFMS